MNQSRIVLLSVVLASLPFSAFAQKQTTETDWLHLVEGYKGESVGAEMRKVEVDEETGGQKLIITIPKIAISHPSEMEEVVVVGQAPEERGPIFDFKYEFEWLDDYDDDHYGLMIRLGEGSSWPIRLYMHSDDGARSQPDLTGQ